VFSTVVGRGAWPAAGDVPAAVAGAGARGASVRRGFASDQGAFEVPRMSAALGGVVRCFETGKPSSRGLAKAHRSWP